MQLCTRTVPINPDVDGYFLHTGEFSAFSLDMSVFAQTDKGGHDIYCVHSVLYCVVLPIHIYIPYINMPNCQAGLWFEQMLQRFFFSFFLSSSSSSIFFMFQVYVHASLIGCVLWGYDIPMILLFSRLYENRC